MDLRDYQVRCLDSIEEGYKSKNLNQLVIGATGTGKSPIYCSIKKHLKLNGPVLVLAHLDFLLYQGIKTWREINPADKIGLEQGENHLDPNENYDVIFASVQTLRGKRLEEILKIPFSLVVRDECHHIGSESDINLIDVLGLSPKRRTSKALFIGLTASPERTDRKEISEYLPYLAFEYNHWSALEEGWWCPVKAKRVFTNSDLEKVGLRNGEYVQAELDKRLISTERTKILYDAWKEVKGEEGRTVIFCSSREYARHINENWPSKKTLYIDGDSKDRKEILSTFQSTPGAVLINVRLIVEGVDVPSITHIILASPIHSGIMHVQALGRGTRPAPGKESLYVLYSVDKAGAKVKLKSPPVLLGLPSSFDLEGLGLLESRQRLQDLTKDSPMSLLSLLEAGRIPDNFVELELALKEIAAYCPSNIQGPLKRNTRLAWVISDMEALLSGELDTAEEFLLNIPAPFKTVPGELQTGQRIILKWEMSHWVKHVYRPTEAKANLQARIRDLQSDLKRETKNYLKQNMWMTLTSLRQRESKIEDKIVETQEFGHDLFTAVKQIDQEIAETIPWSLKIIGLDAPWRSEPPTTGQLSYAKKLGIPVPEKISKGEMTLLIDHRIRQMKK